MNAAVAVVVSLALFLVFRAHGLAETLPLVAVAAAGLVVFTVRFAGALWPVTLALMVTVFCAFLYSWPLQALLPTYLKTELGYDPGPGRGRAVLRRARVRGRFGAGRFRRGPVRDGACLRRGSGGLAGVRRPGVRHRR